MRQTIPLRERPIDWILLGFFVINLGFITYIVDLEQLVIADVTRFEYPLWPPRALVDMVHWWGNNFDPLQNARPPWWRATIWIDVLLFGPFYVAAIWATVKGKEWIRVPAIFWSGVMFANVSIIMFEEYFGPPRDARAGNRDACEPPLVAPAVLRDLAVRAQRAPLQQGSADARSQRQNLSQVGGRNSPGVTVLRNRT